MNRTFKLLSWVISAVLAGLFLLPSIEGNFGADLQNQDIEKWLVGALKPLGFIALIVGVMGKNSKNNPPSDKN